MENPNNPASATGKSSKWLLIIFGAVVLCTIVLRITQWKNADATVPLLTQSPTLIQLVNMDDIKTYTQTSISFPTKTFGSEIFVMGVYPDAIADFPEHSVAIVYVKDSVRVAELDVLSKGYLVEQKSRYANYPQESVSIRGENDGLIVRLRDGFDCLPSKGDHPGMCLMTKLLLMEKDNQLYKLSVDGDHFSDGEMIEMMRSIQ